jgi:hypothetical protein
MSEKQKAIHNAYCDYEVAKAKQPSRIYSVRSEVKRKPQGIKTYNMSRAIFARQLASLF